MSTGNAIELDVDAVCDGKEVLIGAIMEHLEEAGIHSGDSTCFIPPQNIPEKIIEQWTTVIGLELGIMFVAWQHTIRYTGENCMFWSIQRI